MYNTRLKQWRIRKNYRSQDKDKLAQQIALALAENRSVADMTFNSRPVKFDRVLRHCRNAKRMQKTSSFRPRGSIKGSDTKQRASLAPNVDQDEGTKLEGIITPQTRTTPNTDPTFTPVSSADDILDSPAGALTPCTPLSPPKDTVNVAVVLHQTQAYYLNHIDQICAATADIYTTTDKSSIFWTNIKSAIYLLKKQSPVLAWPLLNEACRIACDVLRDAPVLFLNGLFTVLSPVNTARCPKVRNTMLIYLGEMAAIKLSPFHPLSIVCRELARDQNCREMSETALNLTLDLFIKTLGPRHSATFLVHRSLISLSRRGRQLQAAERLAKQLVQATEQAFGSHDKPDRDASVELCIAMTELVHVYSDLGNYAMASELCASVISKYQSIQKDRFPDSRAAYAMEDMAELCHYQHDIDQSVVWLTRALAASWEIRGGTASTIHVREKLEALLLAQGKFKDASELRTRYPRQVEELA